jgi:hypothetical protein
VCWRAQRWEGELNGRVCAWHLRASERASKIEDENVEAEDDEEDEEGQVGEVERGRIGE